MSQVREYETLYIVTPGLAEDEQKGLVEAVAAIVKKHKGETVKNDVWGKRKLAYPIKRKLEGVYILLRYKSVAEVPAEIDVFVKRTPDVLRHLTTVVTKQQINEEARLRGLEAKRIEEAKIAAEEAPNREAEREAKAAALEAEKAAAEAALALEPAPEGITQSPDSTGAAVEESPAQEIPVVEVPVAEAPTAAPTEESKEAVNE